MNTDRMGIRPVNLIANRSQSSLGSFKNTSMAVKAKELAAGQDAREITQMSKEKKNLEEKIVETMQKVKQMQHVSKELKEKEAEIAVLQQGLIRSYDDVNEIKAKYEKSCTVLNEIVKGIVGNDDEQLIKVYPMVCRQMLRLKQKRNSLIIDDLIGRSDVNKGGIKTTRTGKGKNTFVSSSRMSIVNSPRIKKFSISKSTSTAKITPNTDLGSEINDERLQVVVERCKNLIELLSKAKTSN
jgi:hypothetical protein